MSLFGRLFLVGPKLLLSQPTSRFLARRHIKGVRKIFRTKLPKFKKDIGCLPPLTELLTIQDKSFSIEASMELRRKKLYVYKEYLPVNSDTTLLEAILNPSNDIDRLLRIIDANLRTMTSFYVGVSFEAIDDIMRSGQCDLETVLVAPEFKRLHRKTLHKIRFFEADEILKLLKCLSTLRLSGDALLVQAALQMARHFINDFNHDELELLSGTLDLFESAQENDKSLLAAIKVAIPLAKNRQLDERQITTKMLEAQSDGQA